MTESDRLRFFKKTALVAEVERLRARIAALENFKEIVERYVDNSGWPHPELDDAIAATKLK